MIQEESLLVVADNTGALTAKVIRVMKGRYARPGDIVRVAVQTARPDGNIRKKAVVHAVVIRTTYPVRRPDGTSVFSEDNACIITDEEGEPKGTRVFGPAFRELKDKGFQKVVSLASEVI